IGEAALGPLPLVARQSTIAVDVQSRERIGRLRGLAANDLRAREHAVAVSVQPGKRLTAAVPLGPGYVPVTVRIEVVEPIVTVVVCRAQELAQADETVTVGVHARECLCIVVPLLAREPAIAIAIETAKPRLGPVTEPIRVRACVVVLPGGSAGPMHARP